MGFLDRVHNVVTGAGGALQAPVGFVKDLMSAPFTDDEVDGFFNTIYRAGVDRGGQLLGNLLGPEEGLGAAVGGLPEGVRAPARSVIDPAFRGLETVYREGVAEPITTAVTVGSLADAPGGGGIAGLFNPRHWSEAHDIAQDRSPGQALALAFGTKDITDEAEVAEFAATDSYEIVSGLTDAASRLFLDPTVVGGKAAASARTRHLVRPLASADDVNRAVRSGRVARFNQEVGRIVRENPEGAAAQIRHRFFPDHKQGAVISTVLAGEADDVARMQALGALMGHVPSLDALRAERAALAGKLSRLKGERDPLLLHGDDSLFAQPERVARINAELDELYPQLERTEWLDHVAGPVIAETPRLSRLASARTEITRSNFYLESPLAAPLRVTFNMRPQHLVNLEDVSSDVQVVRMLRKSELDLDAQDALRSEYMAAPNANARLSVYQKIESEAVRSIADKAGMTVDEIESVLSQASRQRGEAVSLAKSRVYSADGKRSVLRVEDAEGWHDIHLPLWVTQESNFVPMVNLDRVKQAAGQIRRFRQRHPNFEIPSDLLTKFMRVWRPSVLLRGAWPLRVVGDEQLRIIAKIGALTHTKNLHRAARNYLDDVRNKVPVLDDAGNFVLDESGNPVFQRLPKEQRGQRAVKVRDYELEGPFGAPGDARNIYSELTRSDAAFGRIAGQAEKDLLSRLRTESREWRTVTPIEPEHADAWTHAVNNQIGQDAMGRRLLRGDSVDDVVAWLEGRVPATADDLAAGNLVRAADRDNVGRVVNVHDDGTAAVRFVNKAEGTDATVTLPTADLSPMDGATVASGPAYAARNPVRARDLRRWVETNAGEINDLLPTPRLRELALQRKATIDDLAREFPNASQRPNVSGAVLSQVQGKGPFAKLMLGIEERGFRWLGAQPTNVLSRNRFFDHMYRAEVERLVNVLDDQLKAQGRSLGADDISRIERQAREYALGETRTWLYDLAESSELGEKLRNWVPFYNAFQEVITRWAGLGVENPAFVARMGQVWQSPERAGLVVDENGNRVHSDGVWATNALGERVKAEGEHYLTIGLPEWAQSDLARHMPILGGIATQGAVKFNKESFNLALQGNPGFGPIAQLPVNQIVKHRPELEESVRFILPFGTTQDPALLVMPAYLKRVRTRATGEDDLAYRNAMLRIYYDKVVDYNLGKRSDRPTFEEAKRDTNAFWNMRLAASYFSPAAPSFDSPYQTYINAYRALREQDPETADEQFLDLYGEAYFPLTQSLTRSMDGVPPTLEGREARKKYEDLIEKHPELGRLIVGSEGAGEFARAVYDSQIISDLAPGSALKQREAPAFEEAADAPNVRLGWLNFRRAMDLVDAERIQRGLPNLQVAAARDLANLKRAFIERLADEYPEWYEEFSVVDRNRMERRIEGMREIVDDPRLSQRPDIRGLGRYLRIRDAFSAELSKRAEAGGAKTLDAVANNDLRLLWETFVGKLIEGPDGLAFGDLYHRWLERDLPEAA